MQHVNIKLFALAPDAVRLADAIPVFHRWIQSRACPELLIDVADYTHVPAGPGVLLVGHEAHYALDNARNRPGLLYNRRTRSEAAPVETLLAAYAAAAAAARRLETEPEFAATLRFDWNEVEVTFNDRLLHPNTDDGWAEVAPDVAEFCDSIYGPGAYTLTRSAEPRERLRVNAIRR